MNYQFIYVDFFVLLDLNVFLQCKLTLLCDINKTI